jgi:hypothetical protein
MYVDSNDIKELPAIDFDNLKKSIEFRLTVEIFHKLFLIPDKIYENSYALNAEILERDMEIWKELDEINGYIEKD